MKKGKKLKMDSLKEALKVPLKLHWSSALLLILLLMQTGAFGIVYFAILMFSLLVHEYCHVWAAVRNGLYVKKVVVFALGAAAFIDAKELIFDKKIGLKVAVAGPGGSLALAILSLPLAFFMSGSIFSYFFAINILFCVFNLLPLFPSDGGRILYSLLSFVMLPTKAMKIAVYTSYILSVIGAAVCYLYSQWWLLALFIFLIIFAKAQYEGFKKIAYGEV